METSTERLHALDAVRGFALLLGVAFHATMSFLPGFPVWMVTDNDRTPVLGATFFLLHIFRMSTFFLIAGFFARLSLQKRGTRGFIVDRLKRIGIPLVVGWPIVITAIMAVSIWAVVQATGKMPTAPPPRPAVPFFFPLTHLWFLYVLLWLYTGALALRGLVAAVDRNGTFRGFVDRFVKLVGGNALAPFVLAIPFLIATWLAPVWVKWFGIPTPDMSLIVNPQALAAFGTSFGFGWLVHRQLELLRVWERRWLLNAILAVGLSIACLIMVGPRPILAPAKRDAATLVFAICYALAIWTWTFALIGAAMRFMSNQSPARRYIADASYWIYIIHLPIVMALQVAVAKLGWPWFVKYPLILAVGLALMFASYEWLVRYSFIGTVLNGQRRKRMAKPGSGPALQESQS